MMKTTISCGAVLLFCASLSFAEDAPPTTSNAPNATLDSTFDRDVQIARSLTEASRQATVVANLPFVKKFSTDFDHMTDPDAKSLVATYLDIAQKKLDLKKEYVKKFQKVLPAALVARAMQTEQKLDAMQDFTIARTIPLVPPATTPTGN
jgi:hypothetical protein